MTTERRVQTIRWRMKLKGRYVTIGHVLKQAFAAGQVGYFKRNIAQALQFVNDLVTKQHV